jgi:hypothetical protein
MELRMTLHPHLDPASEARRQNALGKLVSAGLEPIEKKN